MVHGMGVFLFCNQGAQLSTSAGTYCVLVCECRYDTSWGPSAAYSNLWVNDWLSIYAGTTLTTLLTITLTTILTTILTIICAVNDVLSISADPIAKLGVEPPLLLTRGIW